MAFVDLASLTDPEWIPNEARSSLGIPAQDSSDDPIHDLGRHLSSLRLLLIIDNCEHLAESCSSFIEGLLRRCEGLKVLATSRQVLAVKGETVWRVPPLAVNGDNPTDSAAVRLFVERARAAINSFELTPDNRPKILQICHRLDGIPLAIELAAARGGSLPVSKIATHFDSHFRRSIFDGRKPGQSLSRHQALRASMDWSYRLLIERERALLRRLSVFAGGWTVEAAEFVCATDPIQEWEILDLLIGLVEKSLVVYEAVDSGLPVVRAGEPRYRLLETVREYCREELKESGEQDLARRRHLRYFLGMAEESEKTFVGAGQSEWLGRFELEHDNVRAALDWASSFGRAEPDESTVDNWMDDPGIDGLRLAGASWRFWMLRGYLTEGRERFARALAGTWGDTPIRAKALSSAGGLANQQADYQAARSLYTERLAI